MSVLDDAHVRVAVIGAGIAGIGAALQLAEGGEQDFLVLERAGEVGGTWRENVYPGVACDVPAHLYSFSFAPNPAWPSYFASGHQIQEYLRDCAAHDEVRERLSLNTDLLEASWQEDESRWRLSTSRGRFTASFLVLASGRFSTPHLPQLPGLANFQGPVIHTARWQDMETSGRRIGVVGTGASAAQAVPALAARGAQLTVFQRSAPWVLPKQNTDYSPAELAQFADDDDARRSYRQALLSQMDAGLDARRRGGRAHAELRSRALNHLRSQVPDSSLRAQLLPDYEAGCKRVLLSDDWYPALASSRVTLEASALVSVSGQTAVAASGREFELDALVFATGFQASRPAIASTVTGRLSSLAEHWSDGMTSYASTTVSGFPNCFILGGPHSALGHNSAVDIIETQIAHLMDALSQLPEGAVCEVAAEAEHSYTEMIQQRAAHTVWSSSSCTSWYRDRGTGQLTLLWPDTAAAYRREYGRFTADAYAIRVPHRAPAAAGAVP